MVCRGGAMQVLMGMRIKGPNFLMDGRGAAGQGEDRSGMVWHGLGSWV